MKTLIGMAAALLLASTSASADVTFTVEGKLIVAFGALQTYVEDIAGNRYRIRAYSGAPCFDGTFELVGASALPSLDPEYVIVDMDCRDGEQSAGPIIVPH